MFTLNPNNPNFLDTLDFLLKLIGGAGGLLLFFIGIRRYIKEQIWKKNEFVANEIKAFTADSMVRNAMYILDWTERYIPLFPDEIKYDARFVKVDRPILRKALQFHGLRAKQDGKERFTRTEVAIRDTFDHFFAYFEKYYQFIEANLLSEKDLKPYLKYWIETISTGLDEETRNAIYHYINAYGYSGTQQFFKRFGQDIAPKTALETTL